MGRWHAVLTFWTSRTMLRRDEDQGQNNLRSTWKEIWRVPLPWSSSTLWVFCPFREVKTTVQDPARWWVWVLGTRGAGKDDTGATAVGTCGCCEEVAWRLLRRAIGGTWDWASQFCHFIFNQIQGEHWRSYLLAGLRTDKFIIIGTKNLAFAIEQGRDQKNGNDNVK